MSIYCVKLYREDCNEIENNCYHFRSKEKAEERYKSELICGCLHYTKDKKLIRSLSTEELEKFLSDTISKGYHDITIKEMEFDD